MDIDEAGHGLTSIRRMVASLMIEAGVNLNLLVTDSGRRFANDTTAMHIASCSDHSDQGTGMIKKGAIAGNNPLVSVDVEDVRIAATATRVLFGGMAGKSHMKLRLTLKDGEDGATHQELRSVELGSKNSATGAAWSMGATDRGLPGDMGALVSAYLMITARP